MLGLKRISAKQHKNPTAFSNKENWKVEQFAWRTHGVPITETPQEPL